MVPLSCMHGWHFGLKQMAKMLTPHACQRHHFGDQAVRTCRGVPCYFHVDTHSWVTLQIYTLQGVTVCSAHTHTVMCTDGCHRTLFTILLVNLQFLTSFCLEYSRMGPCLTYGLNRGSRNPADQARAPETCGLGPPDACCTGGFSLNVRWGTVFPPSPPTPAPTRPSRQGIRCNPRL